LYGKPAVARARILGVNRKQDHRTEGVDMADKTAANVEELANKSCVPCRGGVPPLGGEALRKLASQVKDWEVVKEHHLTRTYLFPDFAKALAYVNKIGGIAEAEGHHPDIYLAWGKVRVEIWTHKIDGLTESDFILAAKCDRVFA
jgi:4a-hydroxytetrahydrobiopterin dehydratase